MWERLRRFKDLPAPAREQFLRAAVLLPWVKLQLRLQGFRATNDSLQDTDKETSSLEPSDGAQRAAMTARMVRAAARHGIGSPSCLEESLVLVYLLRRQGIDSQLRIGVKKSVPKFEAHAWVESGGAALNEIEALHDHYAAFEAEFTAIPPAQP